MYRKLVSTELEANKFILLPYLAIVLFFFIYLGIKEQGTDDFMTATLISFWACLIITASKSGNEKRGRQYMQLPVTAGEVYFAGWTYCLALLAILLIGWLCYGLVFGDEPLQQLMLSSASTGLGILIFTALVSIGIDLNAFRPRYIQWLYIGAIVMLFALAIHLDLSVALIARDNTGFELLPIALLDNDPLELALATGIFLLLFAANYLAYRHSDNYLA